MNKPNDDAKRTLNMFEGTDHAKEQADLNPPRIDPGPEIRRIPLADGQLGTFSYKPAYHLRIGSSQQVLCGRTIFTDGANVIKGDASGIGSCQACRAEASRLRATIR